jgi:hypothetical protein
VTLSIELHDGSLQRLSDEMADAIYDQLWAITGERGALSLAAKMVHELRQDQSLRNTLILDPAEEDSYWLAHEQVRKRLGTKANKA